MPLGSIFDPGRSLGRHWCIFELLGGSLGIPGSSKDGFSWILGAILEVLGRSVFMFLSVKFNVDFKVDFGMDFEHILDDFWMILGCCFDTLLETANS